MVRRLFEYMRLVRAPHVHAQRRDSPQWQAAERQRLADVQSYSDEQVLEYFATAFGLSSEKIAPSVRERAASDGRLVSLFLEAEPQPGGASHVVVCEAAWW